MPLDIMIEKGTPLEKQEFDWRDLVQTPISKLDDDAFTRVRVILMNGVESDAVRFQHAMSRCNDGGLRIPLAKVRRVEHFQQILVNWLLPPDQSALETTLGYEQTAIEVTAHVAQNEPDPYLAQVYRFGMLEDFDHLYRFSALMDRVDGKDPNNILQNYTDIMPGRPTSVEHRAPEDDVRIPYDKDKAGPLTKIHAHLITAAETQVHDYYLNVGPTFADPVARMLYAEIATIEEQHATQYGSLEDPRESMLEKWMLSQCMEVYAYYSCLQQERNKRVKAIWQRFTDYELGQLHYVMDLYRKIEKRDPAEVLPSALPDPVEFTSHRDFIRETVEKEKDLRAQGTGFIPMDREGPGSPSMAYRHRVNSQGSPSEIIARGYAWAPGTELNEQAIAAQPA
jgi:hypothetical protein